MDEVHLHEHEQSQIRLTQFVQPANAYCMSDPRSEVLNTYKDCRRAVRSFGWCSAVEPRAIQIQSKFLNRYIVFTNTEQLFEIVT